MQIDGIKIKKFLIAIIYVEMCFKGISKLTALSEKMPIDEIVELIQNK